MKTFQILSIIFVISFTATKESKPLFLSYDNLSAIEYSKTANNPSKVNQTIKPVALSSFDALLLSKELSELALSNKNITKGDGLSKTHDDNSSKRDTTPVSHEISLDYLSNSKNEVQRRLMTEEQKRASTEDGNFPKTNDLSLHRDISGLSLSKSKEASIINEALKDSKQFAEDNNNANKPIKELEKLEKIAVTYLDHGDVRPRLGSVKKLDQSNKQEISNAAVTQLKAVPVASQNNPKEGEDNSDKVKVSRTHLIEHGMPLSLQNKLLNREEKDEKAGRGLLELLKEKPTVLRGAPRSEKPKVENNP